MIVPLKEFIRRRKTCQTCEFFKRDICLVNKKYPSDFAQFANESCPKGKWKQSFNRIKTILTGLSKIIKYRLKITPRASEKLIQQRLKICQQCPEYNNGICGKFALATSKTCGCILSLKARIKKERCPQNKW